MVDVSQSEPDRHNAPARLVTQSTTLRVAVGDLRESEDKGMSDGVVKSEGVNARQCE